MTDRLFFALWPDDELRSTLAARLPPLLAGLGGKPQRHDQWHVTLEFLGEVARDRQAALLEAAARVRAEPFTVFFDQLDHWRKPQVVCLAASRIPAPLAGLIAGLRTELAQAGFTPEAREFRPHVTLARKVKAARRARLDPPLAWPADRFALVRSVTAPAGSRYEPLHWWNLSGRGDRETGFSRK
jgi:2'-5' RNA ligase